MSRSNPPSQLPAALRQKRMGRESESLFLYRPEMPLWEAIMWFSFDTGLFLLRGLVPAGGLFVIIQNYWRIQEGRTLARFYFQNTTLRKVEFGLETWFIFEILFYIYIRIKARRLSQKREPPRSLLTTAEQRKVLLDRVLKSVDSVEALVEQWFVDTTVKFDDLSREDVAEITAYCFFHRRKRQLLGKEFDELEGMLEQMEQILGRRIPEKKHSIDEERRFEDLMAKSAMFFTEGEITFQHRPFVMYLVTHYLFQELLAPLRMWWLGGYTKNYTGHTRFWFRPSTSRPGRESIVFFHGIGVGLLPYSLFLSKLEGLADMRGFDLLVVEIPCISQTFSPKPLLPEPFVNDVVHALKLCGHSSARFITHSYGSFCMNWVVTRKPEIVEALILIDPAAVLLHQTDILYNMFYRTCNGTSLDRVLHYIMRSEIHFVHHLKREFFWFHNTMFFESFPEHIKVALVVSEADQVIPVRRIVQYAQQKQVDYITLKGADHGGFLLDLRHMRPVMVRIEKWLDDTDS